jgi:stealth protein CR2/Stealth-like protein
MWRVAKQLAAICYTPGKLNIAQPEPASEIQALPFSSPRDVLSIDERDFSPDFPIDAVYTWVDAGDPGLQAELLHYRSYRKEDATTNFARWISHDELRYSLRSLALYAPWLNKIYIVTSGQRPAWIADHPKIEWVVHSDILESGYLPTFNSHVIESALHRITNLAEHYIYFNDDVMLLRPTEPRHFFTANGLGVAFLGSVSLPKGPPLEEETATNWAAKNARNLMLERGFRAIDIRLAHTCHPQLKSIAAESERMFAHEYHSFRVNRFRATNDLLVSSYLNQGLGYQRGRMLYARVPYWYILIRRQEAKRIYQAIRSERGKLHARLTVCVNDHPEGLSASVERDLTLFLDSYFPDRCCYEKDGPDARA